MAIACDAQSLSLAAGKINQFSAKDKLALLVLYKYRQLNPSTTGQTIPSATLLQNASCLNCSTERSGKNDSLLQSFQVWIQRQKAIDSGAAETTFNANGAMQKITPLRSLSEHELYSILIWLECQLS